MLLWRTGCQTGVLSQKPFVVEEYDHITSYSCTVFLKVLNKWICNCNRSTQSEDRRLHLPVCFYCRTNFLVFVCLMFLRLHELHSIMDRVSTGTKSSPIFLQPSFITHWLSSRYQVGSRGDHLLGGCHVARPQHWPSLLVSALHWKQPAAHVSRFFPPLLLFVWYLQTVNIVASATRIFWHW